MKIYNETLLRNEYAQKLVLRFQKEGLLSDTQAVEIRQLHADVPYNPNIFIKIVLFLFGGTQWKSKKSKALHSCQ